MYEQRGDFVKVMEDKTIPPCNHSARQRAMRETVTRDPKRRARWCEPDENKVEDRNVVAEVEQKVMPRAFLVGIDAHREEIDAPDGVYDM